MGRPQDCADLIHEGYTPSQIAPRLGLSFGTVVPYLFRAVGEDLLHLSDVVFTIPEDTRSAVDSIVTELATDYYGDVTKVAVERGIDIDPNDLRLYLHLRGSHIGDLYFFVADLERSLHILMRRVLAAEYGEAGDMWWHQGVPEKVREGFLGRQGRKGGHPYFYTRRS